MKNQWQKVSKREWYARGGFANSRCVRKARHGVWSYYVVWL